ncbi:ABC transporter, partial [Streptomyces rubrogriseus]|nr:ABC transporter [Streptomyces rubrogriseus]
VSGLVTGSRSGAVPLPLLPLAGAAVIAAGAIAVACALGPRRSSA